MFDELESFDCEEIWQFVKIIKWRKKLPLCQDVERCHNVCWRVHRSPKPFRWYFLTTSRLKVETMKLYELIRRSEGLRTVTHSHLYTSGRKLYLISFSFDLWHINVAMFIEFMPVTMTTIFNATHGYQRHCVTICPMSVCRE